MIDIKDIKALLNNGLTPEQIAEMFDETLNAAYDEKVKEDEAAAKAKAKAKETETQTKTTLNDARAHLISAIGLYNDVFKFGCFDEKAASALEETLKELEDYVMENRETIDMYVSLANSKKNKGFNIFDLL